MKIPKIVRDWAKSLSDDPSEQRDYIQELAYGQLGNNDPDWEKVSEEIAAEEKYNNLNAVVLRHVDSGRYFRFYHESLPYGVTDYGMPDDEYDIVEVFPVPATAYKTREEMRREKADKKHARR